MDRTIQYFQLPNATLYYKVKSLQNLKRVYQYDSSSGGGGSQKRFMDVVTAGMQKDGVTRKDTKDKVR